VLEIRPIMNSCVEEILGFKTCCGAKFIDLNLEIMIRNKGTVPVTVLGYFDLETADRSARIRAVTPPEPRTILPGDVIAYYCFMDETLWGQARRLVFHDSCGGAHSAVVTHEPQEGTTDGNH
jgi:hypothetical protein